MAFQDTTATKRVFQLRKKIRAVAGGTSASKTISILVWIIDYAQTQKNKVVTVVGESVPHLKLGAIRDFQNILISNGYWKDNLWSETSPTRYTFETGTIVEFISFDKFGKAHGPRRDVLFLNEANYLPYNIADQLITRTREVVWMDWNPSEEFWFYTDMLGKRTDIDFIGDKGNYPPLTYLDNEALDQDTINEIEAHRNNKSWWDVYGLGKLGQIEGLIYPEWRVIDEIPKGARLERRWLDFGYTNDPSAAGSVYYLNNEWLLDEIFYLKGMSNRQIANTFLSLPQPQTLIVADSAEPKSIDELRSYGLNVMPCEKGADSVTTGIQVVQDQPIAVTRQSYNILKERRNYLWLVDKNGKVLNQENPACANHHMSGIRYALSTLGKLKQVESYWDRIYSEELKPVAQKDLNPAR